MEKRVLAALLAIFVVGALGASSREAKIFEPQARRGTTPVELHLETAMAEMDRGLRSSDYRESIVFLRTHADEVIAEVGGRLLAEPGSFSKWQLTYLVGEFGDERGIAVLRDLIRTPLPEPLPGEEARHDVDLVYTEAVASRAQAVMSTARIGVLRPALRDRVVAELISTIRDIPLLESSAFFELQKLLGAEFQELRTHFGLEHAKRFEPFMPPPEWQGLLGREMREHERWPGGRAESEPLCRNH